MGTSTPVVCLHCKEGNTPTLRLEQDGSSGFTPQVWDVAGNETNFFIRDATNGSTLPFRIRPSAPTSSIDLAGDGDIGLGTASPDARLHIDTNGGEPSFLINNDGSAGTQFTVAEDGGVGIGTDAPVRTLEISGAGNFDTVGAPTIGLTNTVAARTWSLNVTDTSDGILQIAEGASSHVLILPTSGFMGLGIVPTAPIHHVSGAQLTAAGVWTIASSRAFKQDISDLSTAEATEALQQLNPVTFRYKRQLDEEYVGFIAEDVPALVATKTRKNLSAMDIVAVLTKVLQEQQQRIANLESKLSGLGAP